MAGKGHVPFGINTLRGGETLAHDHHTGRNIGRLAAALLHQSNGSFVIFHQFYSQPAHGQPGQSLLTGNQLRKLGKIRLHGAVVHGKCRPWAAFRRGGQGRAQGLHSTAFLAHRGHNGNAQLTGQPVHINLDRTPFGHVHHIEGQHERRFHFQQLQGQIDVALEIGRVSHVDGHLWRSFKNEVARHFFFQRIGGQAVGSGQVHKLHLAPAKVKISCLFFHRDTGIVCHVLARPGEHVEQRGFAAVGLTGQSR